MKSKKIFIFVFLILIIIFTGLYIANASGYYNNLTKQKDLTEKEILEFEKKLNSGEVIDYDSYISKNVKKYNSSLSDNLFKVSNKIYQGFDKGIKYIFGKMSDIVENS